MSDERRTMKGWAHRLSAPDEPLTLEEARTLAAIAAADRALESRDVLQDVQMRLTRLELFIAATTPGYDETTQALVKRMLTEGGNQHAGL
ncbi:MAG: hypothetical protein AB7P40_28345 [Chloroflexota bacterium]